MLSILVKNKKKNPDDLRKLSAQNMMFSLMLICSVTQDGLKRDSSFILFYLDKTSLRNYSSLSHFPMY